MERIGEGTWFAIDRKLFSSDLWFSTPWKLKIFIYLLGHANHEPGLFVDIPLERGELIRSFRSIAKEIGYKVGYRLKKPAVETIRRNCEELMKERRITLRTSHLGTIFKILNYDELQPKQNIRTRQRTGQSRDSSETAARQDNNTRINIERIVGAGAGAHAIKEAIEIPSWIPIQIWKDWKEFRVRKKAPLTERAVKKTIEELDRLRGAGNDPEAVLEQSIYRGWTGVFALKSDFKKASPQTRAEKVRASMEIMARREYERQAQEDREEKGHRPCSDPDVCLLPDRSL